MLSNNATIIRKSKRARQDNDSDDELSNYPFLSRKSPRLLISNEDIKNIFVGTSGYSYPSWHRSGSFYPKGTRGKELEFYMEQFNSLELNYSFYRIPTQNNLIKWKEKADAVRPNFLFAIKVYKWFTHMKQLNVDDAFKEKWDEFWTVYNVLGDNLGPLLFQFPSNVKYNPDTSVDKLRNLYAILSPHGKYAFEFRDSSWYCSQVYQLFREFDWCLCRLNLNNETGWAGSLSTGNWPPDYVVPYVYSCSWGVYLRYHGTTGQYEGCYGPEFLVGLVKEIENYIREGKKIFIYFNNTDDAKPSSAIQDAKFITDTLHLQI
ncbi:hypothetical protein LOD99_10170 [Oopsacas minuta]|uniref:DUF72 domain-containing protein n=1 Tax=Oopsacas minuta TaxID=111878 RepID=A0AAV7KID7_9METZ|nr:hypothetical protein LOD99_10170 [Oopsacas minuta]